MAKSVTKIVKQRNPLSEEVCFSNDLPPLLKRIYLNRGIRHENEIKTEFSELLSYQSLLNIDKAGELLADGIKAQKKFMIIGDFDTDGATSTALAVSALKALGAKNVDYLIPNRFEYGYGLTPEIVDAAMLKKPDILITVDNGISSHEGVLKAKQYGCEVLVTDHHLPGETLPMADVIINPNQAGDQFQSKNLAGVGVIFYVMLALRNALNAASVNMAQFLDLVALGTVADVVKLDKNNRILVHQGIKRIRKGLCSVGLLSLLKAARRDVSKVNTADLGYAVAPRLNAAGRLEDMSLGVACLLSQDKNLAENMAQELDALNSQRKQIENDMIEQADLAFSKISIKEISTGISLYHPEFHQGVIGILAGRIKDRYHRPVVVFSKVSESELKGSVRSISGIHIRDMLALIDTKHPNLIIKFGGHAMAAGLSIHEKNLKDFSIIFDKTIKENSHEEILESILFTDGKLLPEEFNIESAKLLQDQLIWGQGFPEPLFEGEFEIVEQKLINEKHLKLKVKISKKDIPIDAICFNYNKKIPINNLSQKINLVYKLDINEYLAVQKLQLIVEYVEH